MDGSVKNLLQAEKEAAEIISRADREMNKNLQNAESEAQERVNIEQQGLNSRMDMERRRVSKLSIDCLCSKSYHVYLSI